MGNQSCFSILEHLIFPQALPSEASTKWWASILAGMKRPLCKWTHHEMELLFGYRAKAQVKSSTGKQGMRLKMERRGNVPGLLWATEHCFPWPEKLQNWTSWWNKDKTIRKPSCHGACSRQLTEADFLLEIIKMTAEEAPLFRTASSLRTVPAQGCNTPSFISSGFAVLISSNPYLNPMAWCHHFAKLHHSSKEKFLRTWEKLLWGVFAAINTPKS